MPDVNRRYYQLMKSSLLGSRTEIDYWLNIRPIACYRRPRFVEDPVLKIDDPVLKIIGCRSRVPQFAMYPSHREST